MFLFAKFATALILPPVGPLLLCLLGVVLSRFTRTLGRRIALSAIALQVLLAMPFFAAALSWVVAEGGALPAGRGGDAQAILVLAGGTISDAPEYGGDTVTVLSLERARYGAKLARERGLPVAVSGGTVFGGRPEAEVIGDLLEREMGTPVKWRETQSRNTHENAVESARLLLPEGVRHVLLVTHAVHMRRARREYEAAGFVVTPAPTVIPDPGIATVWDVIPTTSAYRGTTLALHELLGNLKATLDGTP
jgi:uncharacterized SAM-binding protein YcdF (DUF218 family)